MNAKELLEVCLPRLSVRQMLSQSMQEARDLPSKESWKEALEACMEARHLRSIQFTLISDSQDLLEGGQDHWFCPGTTAMSAATFDDRYDKAVFSLRLVEYKPKDRVLLWRTGLEKCMTCVRCIEGYVRAKAILVEQ